MDTFEKEIGNEEDKKLLPFHYFFDQAQAEDKEANNFIISLKFEKVVERIIRVCGKYYILKRKKAPNQK
jgi:hypothetical protein